MFIGKRISTIIVIGFFLLFSLCFTCLADIQSLPTADEINQLVRKLERISADFYRYSWATCICHEYRGQFTTPPNRQKLKDLAKTAADSLQQIVDKQLQLKAVIEDYEGDDWDQRYGSTGLWRKLHADIIKTKLAKCHTDFYLALAGDEPQKTEILRAILIKLDSLKGSESHPLSLMLRAKVLTALSRTDQTYEKPAREFFEKVEQRNHLPAGLARYILLEKLKFAAPADIEDWDKLADDIIAAACPEDMAVILPLAFLRRQFDPDAFEKTLAGCPQAKFHLSPVLLTNYSAAAKQGLLDENLLGRTTAFEAELLALATSEDGPGEHIILLDKLCQYQNTQTPVVLFVTARAHADSDPAKAVTLLLKTAGLQHHRPSKLLDLYPKKIAREATELAYELMTQDPANCALALKAFENYSTVAGEDIDHRLQYLHTLALHNCGDPNGRITLLKKIAVKQKHTYANRARLELAIESLRQRTCRSAEEKIHLAGQLAAVRYTSNDCEFVPDIMELLSQIIERLDDYQANEQDPHPFLNSCKQLSRYCYDCLDGSQRYQAGLFLAEMLALAPETQPYQLSAGENLLAELARQDRKDDIDLLRCRARLYAARHKFTEAARLWARIADLRKTQQPAQNKRNWKWWRAKYHELDCWARSAQSKKQNILHTIEVLENTFTDIPNLWAEKLSLLKQHCLN